MLWESTNLRGKTLTANLPEQVDHCPTCETSIDRFGDAHVAEHLLQGGHFQAAQISSGARQLALLLLSVLSPCTLEHNFALSDTAN